MMIAHIDKKRKALGLDKAQRKSPVRHGYEKGPRLNEEAEHVKDNSISSHQRCT